MANLEELLMTFHALEGNFRSDKKKSLTALMNRIETTLTSEEDQNAFVSKLTPRNELEEIFRVDILIRLRRNRELLEVLKSGKPLLIGKLLKYWKFFEETFGEADARTIVNELLPQTSFNTRVKVINKLSRNVKNEQQANDYFVAIEERYGLKIASIILPGCSLDFIKSTVTKYNLKLREKHLLLIVKKNPKFITFYCEHLKTMNENINYSINEQVIKYIVKVDSKLIWELEEKYKLKLAFGKHTTSKMLQVKSDIDLTDLRYLDMFNFRLVMKNLRKTDEGIRKFCLNFYPENVEKFDSMVYTRNPLVKYFRCVKQGKRYDMINYYFRTKYGRDLHNFPDSITAELIQIMPASEREIVLDEKVKINESLVYMYDTRKSIPIIKERINHSSNIATRKKFIMQLLSTCQFNENPGALLYVLRYMTRHKNDLDVLSSFMQSLADWKNLEEVSSEVWDIINDFLKILEISNRQCGRELTFMERHLIYLVGNQLPYDEHIKSLLVLANRTLSSLNLFDYNLHFKKFSLEQFGTLIPQVFQGKKQKQASMKFLQAIVTYNTTYEDKIPLTNYPEMLNLAKSTVENNSTSREVLNHCVQVYDEYDSYFWDNLKDLRTDRIVTWYIKSKPLKVVENIEKLLTHGVNKSHVKLLKQSRNSTIANKVIKFYSESLRFKDHAQTDHIFIALSQFLTSAEYLEAITDFHPPPDCKIDVKNTSSHEIVEFQREAVKNLSKLDEPSQCLPILSKFCAGDYLKYALSPLYCIVLDTPESKLTSFLENLYKSAVSVRKHAVFLTSMVATKEVVYNFLKVAGETEKNSSLQKAVLRRTLKYLKENPSEEFWNLFRSNINIIDANDREAHDALLDLVAIPKEYWPQYIPTVYEKLQSNSDVEIQNKKYELLHAIPNEVIDSLPEDFLKEIINDTLLVSDIGTYLSMFCVTCIFNANNQKRLNLYEYTLNKWKPYIKKSWDGPVAASARENVYEFVREFCRRSIEFSVENSLVEKFASTWKNLFRPEEIMDEYLFIHFTLIYFGCKSEDRMREFGGKLNEYLHDLVETHGANVVEIFSKAMDDFTSHCLEIANDDDKYFPFTEGFFYANQSSYVYIITLGILCARVLGSSNTNQKYKAMYKLVRDSDVPIVQAYLNRHMREERLTDIE